MAERRWEEELEDEEEELEEELRVDDCVESLERQIRVMTIRLRFITKKFE